MEKQDSTTSKLISSSRELEEALVLFKDINQKAHFIALCAAIEGARMRHKLATFSIVANHISAQAARNNLLSEKFEKILNVVKNMSLESVAVRNFELSSDLIDKVDRNLFERNCDCQAWATFDVIKACLENPGTDNSAAASEQLNQLVSIYCVYLDSILCDKSGKVVAMAKKRDLIEKDLSKESWFCEVLSGKVVVTDLHHNNSIDAKAVLYCAPVVSDRGEVIGVLANIFNWDYVIEMIKSGGYSEQASVLLTNLNNIVIGSKVDNHILNDNLIWMKAGETAAKGSSGYSLEYSRNGAAVATGFAHTKGYNAYKGKGWSALVVEEIPIGELDVRVKEVTSSKDPSEKSEQRLSKSGAKIIESEHLGKMLIDTMSQIDSLVSEINDNNREVKLLAVNASIQAGLAGEDGEGFSIIANEVAALAKKSLAFVILVNQITTALREAVAESSRARLLDAAKDTMSKIDRNLFERFCDIQAFSTFSKFSEVLIEGSSSDALCLALMANVHKIYEVYHDLLLVDSKGSVLATAINRSLIGANFQHEEWFKVAKNGSVYVSDIYFSETFKVPTISFSCPVKGPSGEILGVIASKFNCNFLNDIIRATITDSSSKVHLLNEKSDVVAAANADDVFRVNLGGLKVVEKFSPGTSGIQTENSGNEVTAYFGYSFSSGYNTYKGQKWTVISKRPINESQNQKAMTPAELFKKTRPGKLNQAA